MSKSKWRGVPTAPDHLRDGTRKWWREAVRVYQLDGDAQRLLTLAAEAADRCQEAREAIAAAGSLTFEDRWGQPKKRPEVDIERLSRESYVKCMRALGLADMEPPPEGDALDALGA